MIKLIIGNRGSGKTKILIDMMKEALKTSKGTVVCVDKSKKLMYDVNSAIRLVDVEQYGITGHKSFAGFILGILANNYDITDIFIDSLFKIVGRDYDKLEEFFNSINDYAKDINIVFTVSTDVSELSENVQKLAL